jgi:hypothetical protein
MASGAFWGLRPDIRLFVDISVVLFVDINVVLFVDISVLLFVDISILLKTSWVCPL